VSGPLTSRQVPHPAGLARTRLVERLGELGYLERAAAHVLAGWVPRAVALADKVALARAAHRHMQRANGLHRQVWALTRLEDGVGTVATGARTLMQALDAAPTEAALRMGFDRFLRAHLLTLYRSLAERCDPLLNESTWALCRSAVLDLETRLDSKRQPVSRDWLRQLHALWLARAEGPLLTAKDSLWPPRDRVRFPARSSDLPFDTPGALRTIPIDANRRRRDIAIGLHRNLDGEYTTMELVARNSYEHPDMPWSFHLDALRHASDEARHAVMVERLMAGCGARYGDFPVNTIGYESIYEFRDVPAGSRKELLWRMLLRQTYQEGMALDSLAFEIRRREFLGQRRHAEVFECLMADEVFHAESGLRWSLWLLQGDQDAVRAEREKAVLAWGTELDRRRQAFVERHLDRALDEIAQLEEAERHRDLPFKMTLNVRARLEAGFTERDLEQVLAWGFVAPGTPEG
jgi:uncharacterized ferritin-like protein (DUF455 family)